MSRKRRGLVERVVLASMVALVLLMAPLARAQNTADDLARRHFDSGVAYLEESDYDNALKAFQKAYELSARPEIQLNIATVQERRGDIAGALAALRLYLEKAPQGEHVESVKLRIQNLERRRSSETEGQTEPPPAPVAAAPVAARAQVPPSSPSAPPPPADTASPNRVPAFIVLGIGAAGAVGAVVTGLLAKREYDDKKDSCSPRCTDDELSSGRTLALTSTVLTGVAVVGVGVGLTLWFSSSEPSSEASGESIEVAVRAGPSLTGVSGTLRF